MNIEELLNKYFEGETTCEEERELRRFFTRGIIPEHLQMYRPMFAFLNEDNRHFNTSTANYVIIDGKCYTDAKLVREQAMIAFRDVSISEEEVFATLFSE